MTKNKEERNFVNRAVSIIKYRMNSLLQPTKTKMVYRQKNPFEKGIEWIKTNKLYSDNLDDRKKNTAFQLGFEFVPTLYEIGEKELSFNLVRKEASFQVANGSFLNSKGESSSFKTAQAIQNYLTVLEDLPELQSNLRHACDYLESQITQDGKILNLNFEKIDSCEAAPEYIYLLVLPPLLQAGRRLGNQKLIDATLRGVNHFARHLELLELDSEIVVSSHIFCSAMEALFDLGQIDLGKKGLQNILQLQKQNGAIGAYSNVSWTCPMGIAQLAIASYKYGFKESADKAIEHLEKIQNNSGGFYGSYGKDAHYYPKEEISLAVKFFLDAYMLKIKSDFDKQASSKFVARESIMKYDGRLEEILAFVGNLDDKRILDVGCGKGAYLRVLMEKFPVGQFYGLDISDEMLSFCPKGVHTSVGSMLAIKYPDSYFDCVFSVEALEHAVNIQAAIKEMIRVLKPGGKIVIIDKNISKLGIFKIEPWERWFNPDEVNDIFMKNGVEASYKTLSHDQNCQTDALFIVWEGRKTIR
jgi:malonyl-CoA O-methyltransferase